MSSEALSYSQEKLGLTQARILNFTWEITGAKAVTETPQGIPVLYSFDAITQAQIDAFLTTPFSTSSSEFDGDAFDATSMGTNAFGGIIDMRGQAMDAIWIDSQCNLDPTTDGLVHNSDVKVATLSTTALADNIEVAVSSAGNLAFKQTVTGLDAATDGLIRIQIGWLSN
jgi:hypothetical protein